MLFTLKSGFPCTHNVLRSSLNNKPNAPSTFNTQSCCNPPSPKKNNNNPQTKSAHTNAKYHSVFSSFFFDSSTSVFTSPSLFFFSMYERTSLCSRLILLSELNSLRHS